MFHDLFRHFLDNLWTVLWYKPGLQARCRKKHIIHEYALEELWKLHNYYVAMMTKIDDDPSSPHYRAGKMDYFSEFLKFQYCSVFSNSSSIFQ